MLCSKNSKVIELFPKKRQTFQFQKIETLLIPEYFDALVASTAAEHKADIVSTDPIFSKENITTIW